MINLIVATDLNNAIGKNGKMPDDVTIIIVNRDAVKPNLELLSLSMAVDNEANAPRSDALN